MVDALVLSTTAAHAIADIQNAETAGPSGPVLMQDHPFIEKLPHQKRERIVTIARACAQL